jgi:hypothetical protein
VIDPHLVARLRKLLLESLIVHERFDPRLSLAIDAALVELEL